MIQMIDSNCDNYRINTVLISIAPLFQRYVIVIHFYLMSRGVLGDSREEKIFVLA